MRLVIEARREDPDLSLNAAVFRIGRRVGVNPDTLRGWCRHYEAPLLLPARYRDLAREPRVGLPPHRRWTALLPEREPSLSPVL